MLRHALVRVAVPPSQGLVLLLRPGFLFSGPGGVGGFHRVPSPLYSFGMWSPFRVNSVFLSLLIANEGFHWGGFFSDVASHLGVVSSFSYVLYRFVGVPSG